MPQTEQEKAEALYENALNLFRSFDGDYDLSVSFDEFRTKFNEEHSNGMSGK